MYEISIESRYWDWLGLSTVYGEAFSLTTASSDAPMAASEVRTIGDLRSYLTYVSPGLQIRTLMQRNSDA